LIYSRQDKDIHTESSLLTPFNTTTGHPGTGKSTLVNQIKKTILEKDGCFIEGKFLKSTRPDTVLANALNNFFGSILASSNSGNTMHMSLRWRIHDVIGSGNNVLLEAIPNLRKLMSEDSDSSNNALPKVGARSGRSAMLGSSHRLPFLFCKLIGAIACKAHPLILFLDDLQWADEMTLDVMRMIMTDPDVHHFLFIGTYRDNEVNLSHLLMEKLSDLREQGINVINISVGAIEKECVNTLISEALCLPPALARPLSNVVHSKTGGIIMFLLRFLKSLNDESLLWFSLSARRWEFDLNKIRIKQISEDVVQHMTLTMTKLEKNMQMGLRTAACLGSNFDAEMLRRVKKEDDFDMETFLEKCVEDGYLISIDDTKKFAWTHDQVHQAAYELIPIAQRESFHLLLGSRLLMKSSSQEQGELLFYVVDNMNRGLKLLESSAQKYELSFLNLRAGERGKWMFVNAISALHSLFSVTNSLVLSFHDLFSYFIFSISLRIKILHHRFIIA
jgi:predicted ATPase